MRKAHCFVFLIAAGIGYYSSAADPPAQLPDTANKGGDAAKADLDCTLYTKPYQSTEHGAFPLPAGVKWRVMPSYHGIAPDGDRIVDDRLTLVLEDAKNHFWAVIAKMSLDEAERLSDQLSGMVAQKRRAVERQTP